MRLHVIVSLALTMLLAACASPQPVSLPDSNLTADSVLAEPDGSRSFGGLWLGNAEEGGARVLGLVVGPAMIAGLQPGDRIVRIAEVEVDAPGVYAIFASSAPGTRLSLAIMRGDTPLQIELELGARKRWSGPAAYAAAVPYAVTRLDSTGQRSGAVIEQVFAEVPEAMQVDHRLDRMFAQLAHHDGGYHKLPMIRAALIRPASMTDWRDTLLTRMHLPAVDYGAFVDVMCETLALACPGPEAASVDKNNTVTEFANAIASANQGVRDVFRGVAGGRAQAVSDMRYLLEKTAVDRTLLQHPEVLSGIRAMQVSMRVDLAALLAIANGLLGNSLRLPIPSQTAREPPAVLVAAVEGEIVEFLEVDSGYLVIGGTGPNRYEMDELYSVIDFGGDDIYHWGDAMPLETQTVIDLQGDDRYQALHGGPGAGWLGVSVLIDREGNDHYEAALGGCGAGMLGFGLLFDDVGADNYDCAAWSLGAGLYGGGVLVDGGIESDVYLAQSFSQGVGGPRGIGLLLDAGGADLYRANGPVASTYGVPASYMAFSQGVGVGIRPYDFGGVGALLDLAGDDRYEGGEFSQGGGYYWGLGLLHDEAGNDFYYGNRYAQGFAAHQAFGMLADMSGDDIYWSMTAAAQGAAWDQSIAILFEGGGNDVYRAAALSQGAAAQQGRAWLHDVAGDDTYWSSSESAQGTAGDNSYHYLEQDPIYSIGVMLDEAGVDVYSTGLGNGDTRTQLIFDDAVRGSGVAGVAMDRE